MDSAEQKAGEDRVKRLLIEPLADAGLAKPSTLKNARFEKMISELCAKLAYMTAGGLDALCEEIKENPGGKDKDRFPIALHILKRAAAIEPPSDTASPLLRKVFSDPVGRKAVDEGWGPELRYDVKKLRIYPTRLMCDQAISRAEENIKRMTRLTDLVERSHELSNEDRQWFERRRDAEKICRELTRLGAEQGGGE